MAAPNNPITYILPDEGWAPLLEIIVREAPARSVIEVNTAGMQALVERMLQDVARQDVSCFLSSWLSGDFGEAGSRRGIRPAEVPVKVVILC